MATGIVSIGLHLVGQEALSWILLVLASIAWLALAVDFARQLLRERDRWEVKADTPPALTAVAATTRLGTWFALQGWSGVAVAALVVAVLIWPVLLTAVVRHWRRRLPGTVFLVCVATQGLAVLGGTLVVSLPSGWLAWPTLGCFVLGLALYPIAFLRFDLGRYGPARATSGWRAGRWRSPRSPERSCWPFPPGATPLCTTRCVRSRWSRSRCPCAGTPSSSSPRHAGHVRATT